MICCVLAMEMLQGVWKEHLRPRAVVGYGVKIFLPSPPNYVTRSPGDHLRVRLSLFQSKSKWEICVMVISSFYKNEKSPHSDSL